jgi:hypothetical protein
VEEFVLLLSMAWAGIFTIRWSEERKKREAAQRAFEALREDARQRFDMGSQQLQMTHAAGETASRQLGEAMDYARTADAQLAGLKRQLTEEKRRGEATLSQVQLRADATLSQNQLRGQVVADKYMAEAHDWLLSKLTPNNLETTRGKWAKVLTFCEKYGFPMSQAQQRERDREIVDAFKDAVRKDLARQEQQRIKEQIRDEQKAAREYARAEEQAAREESAVKAALAKALQKVDAEHSAEVAALRSQLDLLAEKKRAMSLAQQTRTGHVYVISNIGSFGDGIFKIGMTRRLEPQDRVDELGDASVPFPFDVHMLISTSDAPALENALHRTFHEHRLNKVNLRKEFFRASIDQIAEVVRKSHGHVDYKATPDAFQFLETKAVEERGSMAFPLEFIEPTLDEQLAET